MKKQAKITSKGQITIPREVRESLGVGPGDKVIFEKNGNDVRVRPLRQKSVFTKYRGIGNPGIGPGRTAVIRALRKHRGHD